MPHFLLTCTTYGTWLPGDARGCVTSVRDLRPGDPVTTSRLRHDRPGEPWEPGMPGLRRSAQRLMASAPLRLGRDEAAIALEQFRETCRVRDSPLLAGAVMANHFHLVIAVREDLRAKRLLTDLKAYASRALNDRDRRVDRWWTRGGSTRPLREDRAVRAAIVYVLHKQPRVLASWGGGA